MKYATNRKRIYLHNSKVRSKGIIIFISNFIFFAVISDYKQRLEKSLKTEKAEHQQTKTNLENKLNEERNKNDKSSSDAKLKLNTLQQHFNLLEVK